MFWDKLEKANYFLENIIQSKEEPLNGRLVSSLLLDPIHQKTLVAFKRRLPNFKSLLQELYQMESQPDEEAEIMVDLPITQLEGDD
jgi:hypothetical protein